MSDYIVEAANQLDAARSLLDQLLTDSRLYKQSSDYKKLLAFVVRLRNFAPFNAMLLEVQKPGLSYAASAPDWKERFKRTIKEGARPLLIMWPFGPVALVYDILDTEGAPLPEDVASFFAQGSIDDESLISFRKKMAKKSIEWYFVDAGDKSAGLIRVVERPVKETDPTKYRIHINRNHLAPTQFTTLAHELAHLFLGHLGADEALSVPKRTNLSHAQRELEAESVAFIVCKRNGVNPKSETYLSAFVEQNTSADQLPIYQVMRAAGQVETLLGLGAKTKYEKPKPVEDPLSLFGESLLLKNTVQPGIS